MAVKISKKKTAQSKAPPQPKGLEKATFEYVFGEDYNPEYANGAIGGPTTQGEICVSFYVERGPLPYSQTFSVKADGQLGEETERDPKVENGSVSLIRYVTTGVIMTRDTAKRVYDFIGRNLQTMDALDKAKQAALAASATSASEVKATKGKGVSKAPRK